MFKKVCIEEEEMTKGNANNKKLWNKALKQDATAERKQNYRNDILSWSDHDDSKGYLFFHLEGNESREKMHCGLQVKASIWRHNYVMHQKFRAPSVIG